MHDYTQLEVWRAARAIASDMYRLTEDMPPREMYGLQSQMRRAAVSIASNIAEGAARSSGRDFARFIEIALGSAAELETQLLIAGDVNLLPLADAEKHVLRLRSFRSRLERLRRHYAG